MELEAVMARLVELRRENSAIWRMLEALLNADAASATGDDDTVRREYFQAGLEYLEVNAAFGRSDRQVLEEQSERP